MSGPRVALSAIAEHDVTVHQGHVLDVLPLLPAASVNCVVTSPPYFGLRDYGVAAQIGLESSPAEYVAEMVKVFAQVRRVLASDGVLWLNLGDSYSNPGGSGSQGETGQRSGRAFTAATAGGRAGRAKNLLMIPARVAIALQDDGWILRNAIVWNPPNSTPESASDRLSCRYENVFLLTRSPRYWFDLGAIKEPLDETRPQRVRARKIAAAKGLTDAHIAAIRAVGITDTGKALTVMSGAGRNRAELQKLAAEAKGALGGYYREFVGPDDKNPGDVWTIPTSPFPGAHFATMPSELARRCIFAGCPPEGVVLDPFAGSGTTLKVARALGRKSVGIELNPEYIDIIRDRIGQTPLDFGTAS